MAIHTLLSDTDRAAGVLVQSRGAVLGGALGVLLGGAILAALLPPLALIPPWSMAGMLPALAAGYTMPGPLVVLSLAALAVMPLISAGIAIYRSQRIAFQLWP